MTEFRPGRFQILPTIIKNLIIINVLVFAGQNVIPKEVFNFDDVLALHTWQSNLFKPWQFFTYMFLHANIQHIFGNLFALWMFGATLENLWGPKRFLMFYLACGLGAALCHMLVLLFENGAMLNALNHINSPYLLNDFLSKYAPKDIQVEPSLDFARMLAQFRLDTPTLGASGAVFGCLAAFGYMFPDEYIYLNFFLPIKAKWFVIGYIALELFLQIQSSSGDAVAHVAHLGGAVVGFLMVYFWKHNNRRNSY